MAKHNIQDAMKLTGKSRRTFYRFMESGRLSYSIELDNRRYFDTSELMRVFGQLDEKALKRAPKQRPLAQVQTDLLTMLVEEVRLLREENQKQSSDLKELSKENKVQAKELELVRKQLSDTPILMPPPAAEHKELNSHQHQPLRIER